MKPLTYSISVPVALTITVVVGSNRVRGWSEACADDEIYDNGKGIYRHAQGDEEEAACEAADAYVGSAFAALHAQPELLAALRALVANTFWTDDNDLTREEFDAMHANASAALAERIKEEHEEHIEQLDLSGLMADLLNAGSREINWREIAEHRVSDAEWEPLDAEEEDSEDESDEDTDPEGENDGAR